MSNKTIGKCRQQGCTVEESGTCLEGLEPEKCPHFIIPTPEDVQEINGSEVAAMQAAEQPKDVELPDGVEFTLEKSSRITHSSVTRLIVLAGAAESGKTTLIASLYECFQWGLFAGYLFAGSETLMGFESRCHLARTASERVKPDTERTKPGTGQTLLHLQVRAEDLSRPVQNLLISDISGEIFRLAKDSTDEVRRLGMLKMADHFVLLLDGRKLSQPLTRQETFIDGASLLRSCLDANMLDERSLIDVLFTKWDLIEDSNDRAKTIDFLNHIKSDMEKRFKTRVGRLSFFHIAARPEKPPLKFGFGLKDIFPFWVEETRLYSYKKQSKPFNYALEREFDRYLFRQLNLLIRK